MNRLKDLKNKILYCLEKFPDTRNSDIKLTNCIWINFYSDSISKIDGAYYVKLTELYQLPREDNVKRIRAEIQNIKKMYLPTNAEVAKQRGWNEEEWRKYLGFNPELREVR